ncbi:MAG TPA: sugar phosphate isomerase/epimerase [Vicinamibacterales bacterium]|nr:sugar phosphate isomerase/epimerase [Vicinamibacterales bacterium]
MSALPRTPDRPEPPFRPRLLASTTSHKRESLLATLAVFARLGLNDLDLNLHPFIEGDMTAMKAADAIAAQGLRIWATSGGWCDFFQGLPDIEKTFASVEKQVGIADHLRAPQLRLFFGRRTFFDYSQAAHDFVCRNLVRLSALHPGMLFVFENHDGASLHPEVCAEILDHVDRPNIRMNFDPINFAKAHVDPMTALEIVRPYVAHVHLKGLNKGAFCEFGAGQVDLTPVVQSLVNAGYRGSFSVEYEGPDDATVRLFEGYTRATSLLQRLMS